MATSSLGLHITLRPASDIIPGLEAAVAATAADRYERPVIIGTVTSGGRCEAITINASDFASDLNPPDGLV